MAIISRSRRVYLRWLGAAVFGGALAACSLSEPSLAEQAEGGPGTGGSEAGASGGSSARGSGGTSAGGGAGTAGSSGGLEPTEAGDGGAPDVDVPDADSDDADAQPVTPLPDGAACDPPTGAGCGRGEKCGWAIEPHDTTCCEGHAECQPVEGNATQDEPCKRDPTDTRDDCGAGFYCAAGHCKRLCTRDTGCGAEHVCTGDHYFGAAKFGICEPTCDLVTQNCAADGYGCRFAGSGDFGLCFQAVGTQTSDCEPGRDCAKGYECITFSPATIGTCRPYCRVGGTFCGSTATCTSFSELYGASIGDAFGVCLPR